MARSHRGGDVSAVSTRQRVIVVTFPTPADAEAWDAAGQPLELPTERPGECWTVAEAVDA